MAGFGEKSIPVTITTLQSGPKLSPYGDPRSGLSENGEVLYRGPRGDPDSQQLRMDYITATWKPSTAVGNLGLGTRLAFAVLNIEYIVEAMHKEVPYSPE
ncbi:hypothetical protein EMCRGX_G003056 [Ephydatia muelleri]